ncbi:YVTN repeat-like/Quino protein amine dehydrogenase [Viridothelium virens]|uniref:YVTN repeat-like/Quino protein amine dehydrogenase n=1 Tax=Viridothelium virens TaxID=1048519 RepID=A0A6A6GYQ3_VIRVR|nr:YVTN repeat-like/Quino protein amine dehydrogenase [Viridothelium virens]
MRTDHTAHLTHFQLRHLISAPSRNDIFYAAGSQVIHVNTSTPSTKPIINLHTPSSPLSPRTTSPFNITTLAATPAVLLTASFTGEYAYLPLSSPTTPPPILGRVTPSPSDITNHIQPSASRSLPLSTPLAAFASNDHHLRILHTATNRMLASFAYPAALNASAISPDARLRALVSDASSPWITDAETGEVMVELRGVHQDAGFAVAWADDGVTLATASQDEKVAVWDARWWKEPMAVLHSQMAAPRALAFSPVGCGRRVLVVGEAEDVVGVVEMDGGGEWARRDIEFFGSVGGIAMGPDGEELWVANCDATVGGLMEFERCGGEGEGDWVEDPERDVRTARRKAERRYRFRESGQVVV